MKNKVLSKIVLITILSIFLKNTAYSQTNMYHPFKTVFTSWLYNNYSFDGNNLNEYYSAVVWNGDTTINSLVYTKIESNVYNGSIREDIPNEQVYYIDILDVEHNISIDNHVNISDTITVDAIIFHALTGDSNNSYSSANGIQYDSLIVAGIDSILIENLYHKTYRFNQLTQIGGSYPAGVSYINGVGFSELSGFENGKSLFCYHADGEQLWGQQSFGGEYYCTATIETKTISKMNIYPNPSQDKITIDYGENEYGIKLFDLYGKMIFSKQHNINGTVIDISTLTTGIYLAEITLKNQTIVQKIMVD